MVRRKEWGKVSSGETKRSKIKITVPEKPRVTRGGSLG
jgi:hypothetical protein